ncbi:uncharacterized protein LOC144104827 [Amblyomma americanum]
MTSLPKERAQSRAQDATRKTRQEKNHRDSNLDLPALYLAKGSLFGWISAPGSDTSSEGSAGDFALGDETVDEFPYVKISRAEMKKQRAMLANIEQKLKFVAKNLTEKSVVMPEVMLNKFLEVEQIKFEMRKMQEENRRLKEEVHRRDEFIRANGLELSGAGAGLVIQQAFEPFEDTSVLQEQQQNACLPNNSQRQAKDAMRRKMLRDAQMEEKKRKHKQRPAEEEHAWPRENAFSVDKPRARPMTHATETEDWEHELRADDVESLEHDSTEHLDKVINRFKGGIREGHLEDPD